MDFDKFDKILFFSILGFIILLVYLYYLGDFIQNNIIWIFFIIVYFALFILRDFNLKKKDYEDRMRIKNRDKIRLNPYSII